MKIFLVSLLSVVFCHFANAQVAKIKLTGNDQIQYSMKSFEVTEGQKVLISFKHVGKIPAEAMGHNVVILKPGTIVPLFATKSMTQKDNDYIPVDPEALDMIVAYSKLLGGGESDLMSFTAPAAGEYPFICTFPGHFSLMQGVMTVKAK